MSSLNISSFSLLLLLLLLPSSIHANSYGIDVSTAVSATAATCMKNKYNLTFGIARAWYSDGSGFDHNCVESVKSWKAAGIDADVYMFPCSFGLSAADQVKNLMSDLATNQVQFGRIWFDVETNPDPKCSWSSSNKTANCEFMKELVVAAAETNALWGIYSSIHMWTTWMSTDPNGCTSGSSLPLWYPHYQKPADPSFDDFVEFGGWTKPSIKQYADGYAPGYNSPMCGVGVDNNWTPKWPII
jgi:hypothetical protein